MPIDTSSYYPEVDGPDGQKKEDSLNGVHDSLFGKSTIELDRELIADDDNFKPAPESPSPKPGKADNLKWEKIADTGAHILSWVLTPLIMPVFGILFIFRLSILDVISANLQTAVTFVIAGITFFAPMLLIFLLKVVGVVKDPGLNNQKERPIPYLITAVCYGCSAWFVASRGAPVWVAMFFCGGALAALINMAINFKWKISAHSAAIAGLVALLIRMQRDVAVESHLFVWLLITVGMAGLLGSARIWLGRHTVWQVLAGYLVGFCSVFFMMYIR